MYFAVRWYFNTALAAEIGESDLEMFKLSINKTADVHNMWE